MSVEATDHPTLFPLPEAPKRVKTKWEQVQEMAEVGAQVGGLIPPTVACVLLDLSKQRMYVLIGEGTFRCWEFFGKKYVSLLDVREFIDLDRKSGRPWNNPSLKESWRRSKELVTGKK